MTVKARGPALGWVLRHIRHQQGRTTSHDRAYGLAAGRGECLFNLPGYHVVDAVEAVADDGQSSRLVVIASTAAEAACPACGVLSGRVHQVRRNRLRDIPVAGPTEVVLIRRRIVCAETRCAKRTFAETTD